VPQATPQDIAEARAALGIPPERMPRHVAIIMDGNGRWAQQRGLPRPAGHSEGAHVVRRIVTESQRVGLEALTLYSFSLENWRRPKEEVAALMGLYAEHLRRERPTLMEQNTRLRHLGRREGLPDSVLAELDESTRVTRNNTGMWLNLALNYGGRTELTDAVRKIAARAAAGEIRPDQIDEQIISDSLGTTGITDPDLLIRTAGEMRISNFLLWQVSYAEFYVTDVLWPDFDETEFGKALVAFAQRHRRFGGLDTTNS
jgi:undecaprenyl diphosphate synthase